MNILQLILQTYLNKFSNTIKLINDAINNDCKQIIIIPSYCEPDLQETLKSLTNCLSPNFIIEVIIVLNCSVEDIEALQFHEKQKKQLEQIYSVHGNLIFHFILISNLPLKHAGVGLARKIGMDEAIRRFHSINYDGLLTCLDADCLVSKNYLLELEKIAVVPENYNTICLNFEHEIITEKNEELKTGIIFYELFLRYYKEGLSYCGFEYPFHTIGSSMAVKASIYCKAGGMNKRKAGEDFYFLTKVFSFGKVIELNNVTVVPSARISTRVPFGTGRAQQNFIETKDETYTSYSFQTFEDLKQFFAIDFYEAEFDFTSLPLSLKQFVQEAELRNKLAEIKNNTSSKQQFQKRFFDWFDSFMVLKFVHFARDNNYPKSDILQEVKKLIAKKENILNLVSKEDVLLYLRELQRKTNF
ncbi:MAG: glycosyltransferase family A protein [Bacteroidota bacterium]|nr:glycosyltransferase family A protein [Bacteroidota bacterium]